MSAADSQSACTNTHYIKKTGGGSKKDSASKGSLSLSLPLLVCKSRFFKYECFNYNKTHCV